MADLTSEHIDFVGFTYGNYHSSQLGIKRVSDGTRYSDDLSPTNSDKTVVRPGADGTYFFGVYFSQKPMELNIAFDNVTECQLRTLRQVFSNKMPQKLIFDEAPYKYYLVKPLTPPNLRYLCFDEGGNRIYKGEGVLSLVAYYPYAKSVYKSLDKYNNENKSEWAEASGMLESLDNHDKFIGNSSSASGKFILYNAGDLNTNFCLTIKPNNSLGIISDSGIHLFLGENAEVSEHQLFLKQIQLKGNDDSICINSANNLIEGYSQGKRSGNLYNEYKYAGEFFQIPIGDTILTIIGLDDTNTITITYDYLYY